jgi:chorismate synthase
MSCSIGKNVKITLFGQSHSEAIGVVIDGLPAGEAVDFDEIEAFMARRAPGKSALSTARRETDRPELLSGLVGGKTCGAPIAARIANTDARTSDYEALADVPRPSHADYPAFVKYGGFNDIRGGGLFSGRMTAPLCLAGAIALQLLKRRGVFIGAHIAAIGGISDSLFDPTAVRREDLMSLQSREFPVICARAGAEMKKEILLAKEALDSVGGVIECAALGLPAGVGDPIFGSLESALSQLLFSIPAVKGVEFGSGFEASRMRGSTHNDPYFYENGRVKTRTNNHGGILGGISTGMPVIFRTAFKPTPSIGIPQQSVSLSEKTDVTFTVKGRHDPCIVPRAVPAVEAAAAIVLLDKML